MRVSRYLVLPLLVAVAVVGCRPYAGYEASASFGTGVDVYGYAPEYWGDWRTNYMQWSPTVVFEYGGRYYPTQVRGSRPVSVYQYRNQYFMPPRDNAWNRTDKRFDYKHRPNNQDYQRARPRPQGRGGGA